MKIRKSFVGIELHKIVKNYKMKKRKKQKTQTQTEVGNKEVLTIKERQGQIKKMTVIKEIKYAILHLICCI